MNIKKTIAREGLVILGIIAVGGLIILLSFVFPPYPAPINSKFDITTAKPVENTRDYYAEEIEGKKSSQYLSETDKSNQDSNEWVDVPVDTAKKVVTDLLTKKSYRLSDIERMNRGQQNINNAGFFIIFLGYPVYLIIRFITWSIRILREK